MMVIIMVRRIMLMLMTMTMRRMFLIMIMMMIMMIRRRRRRRRIMKMKMKMMMMIMYDFCSSFARLPSHFKCFTRADCDRRGRQKTTKKQKQKKNQPLSLTKFPKVKKKRKQGSLAGAAR